MSRTISFHSFAQLLPSIRMQLRYMKLARSVRDWHRADQIRDLLLRFDSGMKITVAKDGKVTLWHFPNPPFFDQLHYCNYGEFIANSEEA